MVNRTQALVLGFFLVALTSLVVILAAAPEIYDQALRLPSDSPRWVAFTFLAVLAVFIGLLAMGVLRRWRWTFWLVLVAFLAGVLRVPVAGLELIGVVAADGPTWYVVFQGLLGVLQFAIGLAMVAATGALVSGGPSRSGLLGSCAVGSVAAHAGRTSTTSTAAFATASRKWPAVGEATAWRASKGSSSATVPASR